MSDDLEKIYRKFFDDSGKMREAGTNILKKGMSDLKSSGASLTEGPKTLTEKGFFQPKSLKAAETIGKAAKATRIGKIATGVVAAGYGVKKYLESKMSKPEVEDVEKKSKGGMNKYSTGKSVKGYGQARKSGMGLEDENVSLGKGADYIKDLL